MTPKKHLVTNRQKSSLQGVLQGIETTEKHTLGAFPVVDKIEVLGSPYTHEIFVRYTCSFMNQNGEAEQETKIKGITTDGTVSDNLHDREFKTLSDRVHFFNTLYEIQY